MHSSYQSLSFANLRPWNGSQDRAFEELSYQLLKDEVAPNSIAIRTGNPDGGVEWYCDLPNGDQWGWQAKNIRDIDVLLTAMSKSVNQIAAERTQLVRLTFIIPWNLPAGTAKGKRKSARKRYEDQIETWKQNIPGADRIQFDLKQESDLVEKLARPEHRGRRWFWWESPTLGLDWLRNFQEQQASIAGEKYRPDLQVDLPIAEDLRGLGFSQVLGDEFAALRRRLNKEFRHHSEIETPFTELNSSGYTMLAEAKHIADLLGQDDPLSQAISRFDALEAAVESCRTTIREVRTSGYRRRDEAESKEKKEKEVTGSDRVTIDALNNLLHRCNSLYAAMTDLQEWLQKSATRALRERRYFLVGPAGSGKTHLFLDAARVALDEGRPTVVLHGARFRGNLWSDICDQLGLPPLGGEVLLGAMDAAAEAAGTDGRYFVLAIDALNETPVSRYWETHLPVLRAAVQHWPHLALAVSCRETYVDVIDPNNEREKFVEVAHPGFAGRETEATQKYFSFYGLEIPRIPLLTPEFTVPLFLRLYCEGLREGGKSDAAVGHESRVEIFERYLNAKIVRVAHKVFHQASSNFAKEYNLRRIKASLDALLDGMANADSEWLKIDQAMETVSQSLGGNSDLAVSVIGAFEDEGVLSQEPTYLRGNGDSTAIRVTFQAFSDFLLLKRRLNSQATPVEDAGFIAWLRDEASWGIREASAVVIPELYGIEIPDLLQIVADDLELRHDDRNRFDLARRVYESLIETLPYRSAASISQRTIDLLNIGLRSEHIYVDFYKILYMIAPQPNNLFNAAGLHRHLMRQTMPHRDASYGFAVYDEIWNESSPVTRLARWAAFGPYPSYPSEVIELASVALTWLLSSPNRFMRDWVTKALVQLLHGHLDVMGNLFERFWGVDDPYVVQRVTAVAYGCLMRGGLTDPDGAAKLANIVLERVFSRPMRADELMLDAGRGVIEWSVAHGVLPTSAMDATKRPYGFKTLGNPPTEERLKAIYPTGYPERVSDSESYGTIWGSLFDWGDFGRYVVDSGMHNFSRYRHGEKESTPEDQEPRLLERKWTKFMHSFTPAQHAAWESSNAEEADDNPERLHWLVDEDSPNRLTAQQWELFHAAWAPRPPKKSEWYPNERARRWIFSRVISLGWTPQLFGERDWMIGRLDQGRSEHKEERWGKKYQWMAYHELLARIADNYQMSRQWSGEREPYDGLQQLTGDREIDPSLPPIDYRRLSESRGDSTSTWRPSKQRLRPSVSPPLEFNSYQGDIDRFVEDRQTFPTVIRVAQVKDDAGENWIALDGYEEQSEKTHQWEERSLDQRLFINSVLVPRSSARNDAQRLTQASQDDPWALGNHGHTDCCYAGEIGWSRRVCPYRSDQERTIGRASEAVSVVDTVESYIWEGNILDCSIGETVRATMPSSYICARTKLRIVTDGPSWIDATGQVVAVSMQADSGAWSGKFWHVLWARERWLKAFLADYGLALVVVTSFERRLLDKQRTYTHRSLEGWSGGVLYEDSALHEIGATVLKHKNGDLESED